MSIPYDWHVLPTNASMLNTQRHKTFQNYVQKYQTNIFFLIVVVILTSNDLHLHRKSLCNLKPLHRTSKYVTGR